MFWSGSVSVSAFCYNAYEVILEHLLMCTMWISEQLFSKIVYPRCIYSQINKIVQRPISEVMFKRWILEELTETKMHFSRMRTVRCSGRISCHARPPPSHAHPPPPRMPPTPRLTHTSENIAFPQLRLRMVIICERWILDELLII